MNTDEMKRLAEIVYPDKQFEIRGGVVVTPFGCNYNGDITGGTEFKPSLTGAAWQKAQALDVIVAALSLPGTLALHKFETTKGTYFQFIRNRDPGLTWEDPLQAACAALLSQEGRG